VGINAGSASATTPVLLGSDHTCCSMHKAAAEAAMVHVAKALKFRQMDTNSGIVKTVCRQQENRDQI